MLKKSLRLGKGVFAVALAGGYLVFGAVKAPAWPNVPFVSVQATDPLAAEPGDIPGTFTISRFGDTNSAVTIPFSLRGTASNGVDYAAIPTSVTLAAGELSTNITLTPISEPNASGYKTVKLTIPHERFEWGDTPPPFITGSLNHALIYIAYKYTNVPPNVSLTGPTNASSFLSKPNMLLTAAASDSNGWVTSVEFIANGASLGTVSNYLFDDFRPVPLVLRESHGSVVPLVPGHHLDRFQFVWTAVSPGIYNLQAIATDNAGLQSTSTAVAITVTTNLPEPQVRIINPGKSAEFPDQAPIHLYAAAGETNGVVDTVEFFANGASIGTATNYLATEPMGHIPLRLQWLPYNFTWTNAPVGSNILTAVATDNNGAIVTSAPVNINVTTNLFHHRHPW